MSKSATIADALGGDDALNEELLTSLRDTGMYGFASEFDIISELDRGIRGGDGASPSNRGGMGVAPGLPAINTKLAEASVDNTVEAHTPSAYNLNLGKGAAAAAALAVKESRKLVEQAQGDGEMSPKKTEIAGDGLASTPLSNEFGSASKKRKMSRASLGGDKNGKGLRHFSMKVCEKVESKQRTTYNEVADELVAEFSNPENIMADQAYDEKNIRRRVYDALNVLMAMNIITKEKKEIMWKGLPTTTESDIEHLKAEKYRAAGQIEKKNLYLQELVEQYNSYQALLQRNTKHLQQTGGSANGIQLPFILVQTKPQATVEVDISEDQQVVHLDFNSTPFQIHDGNFVLQNMNLTGTNASNHGKDPVKLETEDGIVGGASGGVGASSQHGAS